MTLFLAPAEIGPGGSNLRRSRLTRQRMLRRLATALVLGCTVFLPGPAVAADTGDVAAVPPSIADEGGFSPGTRTQLEDALRALKTSKNLGRAEAERALASINAFQEARQNRHPPRALETELAGCLTAPTPPCLLEEALAHAYRVPDEGRRNWALSAVAAAYYETGIEEKVFTVVALMDDPRTALRLLQQTVGAAPALAASFEKDTVASAAESNRSNAYWISSAEAGDWTAAQAEIRAIAKGRYRAVAWARFGRMAIRAGEAALARDALRASESLIEKIGLSYARSFARYEASLTHVERVQRSNGGEAETQASVEAASLIEQPHFRADIFWRLAEVGPAAHAQDIQERAEASFAKIASRLRQVFVLTAVEMAGEQRQDRALAIAATISDPLDRARAFTRLARSVP